MELDNDEPTKAQELVPLNVIRVETALSRCPVHRLAKQGTASIEIREQSPDGEMVIQWEVTHNSKYGQPGPLAYRIDTLIVNRRIEEAPRPIPEIIKLGSLHDICRELNLRGGSPREHVKQALYQNAFVGITAKLKYKLADGKQKDLEAAFTRYSVVFTGEELPDGRRADAVYLVLSSVFLQVLNGAQVRPLDYDYLKDLPPASQRLYELLSFQIYGALKNKRKDARLSYSQFCTYAPLTRFLKWDQVRPQMARIHKPHLKSGYIESIEFQQSTDRDGNPDWMMVYVPGPKARAEFRGFGVRGEPRTLEIATPATRTAHSHEPSPLERELIDQGVTAVTAAELVGEFSEERVRRQIEQLEWLREKKSRKGPTDPAAYLVDAIRKDYAAPSGFESKADRAKREAAKREQERRKAEAARREREATATVEKERARITSYLAGLDAKGLEKFEREALAGTSPERLASYHEAPRQLKSFHLRVIREAHARRILGLPELAED